MDNYEGMIIIHDYIYKLNETQDGLICATGNGGNFLFDQLRMDIEGCSGYFDPVDNSFHHPEEEPAGGHYFYWWQYFHLPADLCQNNQHLHAERVSDLNQRSIERGLGYLVIDGALSKRLTGKLQQIEFDGINYTIDTSAKEIRQTASPSLKFRFPDQPYHAELTFFYNTRTKKPVEIRSQLEKHPPEVVCVTIPALSKLDPIGFLPADLRPTSDIGLRRITDSPWKADPLEIKVSPLSVENIAEGIRWRRYFKHKNLMDQEEKKDPSLVERRHNSNMRRWRGAF